jgi:predicted RNA-binding protein YlqC (UPF0109 family)
MDLVDEEDEVNVRQKKEVNEKTVQLKVFLKNFEMTISFLF